MATRRSAAGETLLRVDIDGTIRRLWSSAEFRRAGELGLFDPEERVELIGGEITRKMTPQTSEHASAISLISEALRTFLPAGHHVRIQLPLALSSQSEPEPDVAIVAGEIRDYEQEHPATAVLVVEVADTTLVFDRTIKASLYASAAIPEYWIVNLRDLVLEVHRDPAAMADQPFAHHYRSITRSTPADHITCTAVPGMAIAVANLLPRHPRSL